MDGTADRSGILFDPLTPTPRNVLPAFPPNGFHVVVSLGERGYGEEKHTGGRAHAHGRSLRPTVPKPPPPPRSPPCRAARTGLGACRLPALIRR
jgi:hypothetical protein